MFSICSPMFSMMCLHIPYNRSIYLAFIALLL
jgi:hypothetical protein